MPAKSFWSYYERVMARTVQGPTVRPELGPCLDCTYTPNTEYPFVLLADRKTTHASRVVLEHKLGRPIKHGYWALHHCNNPRCVHEDHMYEGTRADNVRDMYERNTFVRTRIGKANQGSNHGLTHLTESDIVDIKAALDGGTVQRRLAEAYNVSYSTISRIALGQCWAHVENSGGALS